MKNCSVTANLGFIAIWLLLALSRISSAQAAPSLDLGSAGGVPGTTVAIPVTLKNAAGISISAVSMDIGYDTSKLESPTAALGPVAAAAGKTVSSSSPASGVFRIGVYGYNATAISDGVVVNVSFMVKATASTAEVTLSNTPDASNPNGATVIMSGAGGIASVVATPKAKVNTIGFNTLQSAYDDTTATSGDKTISLLEGILPGALTAGRNITVTLEGGNNSVYAATYTKTSTTIGAPVIITKGTLIMKEIRIK